MTFQHVDKLGQNGSNYIHAYSVHLDFTSFSCKLQGLPYLQLTLNFKYIDTAIYVSLECIFTVAFFRNTWVKHNETKD